MKSKIINIIVKANDNIFLPVFGENFIKAYPVLDAELIYSSSEDNKVYYTFLVYSDADAFIECFNKYSEKYQPAYIKTEVTEGKHFIKFKISNTTTNDRPIPKLDNLFKYLNEETVYVLENDIHTESHPFITVKAKLFAGHFLNSDELVLFLIYHDNFEQDLIVDVVIPSYKNMVSILTDKILELVGNVHYDMEQRLVVSKDVLRFGMLIDSKTPLQYGGMNEWMAKYL